MNGEEKSFVVKKGSVEWTIGKLLSSVLLILLLVLVVYGISTGGFKPLIEKVSGIFDGVLILFNLGGGDANIECFSDNVHVDGVGEGIINRCVDYCNLTILDSVSGIDDFIGFEYFDGKMQPLIKGGKKYTGTIFLDIERGEEARNAYDSLNKVFYDSVFLSGNWNDFSRDQIGNIFGHMSSNFLVFKIKSGGYLYRWDGDVWKVVHGRYDYIESKEVGIDSLWKAYVSGDGVSWGYQWPDGANKIPLTEEIGESKGGWFRELFGDKSIVKDEEKFKEWMRDKIDGWSLNNFLNKKLIDELSNNSKKIFVNFKGTDFISEKDFPYHVSEKYTVIVSSSGVGEIKVHSIPVLYFDSSNDKRWGIFFNVSSMHLSFGENFEDMSFDAIVRLNEEKWNRMKVLNLVNNYMAENC